MTSVVDLRPLHRRALDEAGVVLARILPRDLARPTPCAGWDLHTLVAHVLGQNHGFADAVEFTDAPRSAFAPRPPDPSGLAPAWRASADRVAEAFADAPPDREVRLAEISPQTRFPVATALGIHLLDTVVHTWDIATTMGETFRPDEELVVATLTRARQVPDGPARQGPDAVFAPPLPATDGAEAWEYVLALLGRAGPD